MEHEQDVSLRQFGDGQPAPAGDLADLHRKLLPTSPLLLNPFDFTTYRES